jgi:hypothetical protein
MYTLISIYALSVSTVYIGSVEFKNNEHGNLSYLYVNCVTKVDTFNSPI